MVDSWLSSQGFVRVLALATSFASLPMGLSCFAASWITPSRGIGPGSAHAGLPAGLKSGPGVRVPGRWSCGHMNKPFSRHPRSESKSRLFMSIDSRDPFHVLGLNEPTSDLKMIRRAYKRMALKYHPDVATTKDSSAQEKKEASDRFAKINWAYETLSGKRKDDTTYNTKKTGATGSSNNNNEWTPPHRRAGSYSANSQTTPSWEDFIPKYDDEQYDAGGDSFEKIFSDLFTGAAVGATGMGGGAGTRIFKDFVEFLEGNIDGYGTSSNDDDADLRILLATGSVEDIGNEMDDTELVIKQLKSKMDSITNEVFTLQAELKVASRYVDKIELEESLAELNARKDVVDGYLKKAQKRLLKIQTRYKEKIVSGQNDKYATGAGSSDSSWDDTSSETASSTRSTTDKAPQTSGFSYASSSNNASSDTRATSRTDRTKSKPEDSWMEDGFGASSSGRRRGSSRRSRADRTTRRGGAESRDPSARNRASTSTAQSHRQSPPSYTTRNPTDSKPAPSTGSEVQQTRKSANKNREPNVPPHRRQSSFQSQQEEKRRLRELIVDDEFEKLKKDLGL